MLQNVCTFCSLLFSAGISCLQWGKRGRAEEGRSVALTEISGISE